MKVVKTNLNNHIRVKLTEAGKVHVLFYYNSLIPSNFDRMTRNDIENHSDENGYNMQIHEFVDCFGNTAQSNLLEDFNILIEVT